MPCGWEGNRRSGVALAMRHCSGSSTYGLTGDEHPAYTPHAVWHSFNFLFNDSAWRQSGVNNLPSYAAAPWPGIELATS